MILKLDMSSPTTKFVQTYWNNDESIVEGVGSTLSPFNYVSVGSGHGRKLIIVIGRWHGNLISVFWG